jgi:hypothetical protein
MDRNFFSWLSQSVEVGQSLILPGQRGIVATADIRAGEIVMVMGGPIVDIPTHNQIGSFGEEYGIDISEHFSFCPSNEEELAKMPQFFINHSCEPNTGFLDQLQLVAIQDIRSGEEITYDYAFVLFSNPDNQHRFFVDCRCQTPLCRRSITCDDWMIPKLHAKYGRWFQPFLRRRFYDLHPGWSDKAELEVPCPVITSGKKVPRTDAPQQAYFAQHRNFLSPV